ncbi:hypothetical protein TR51_16565 [Kitasatospora griseola]|uniref:Tat pathway signal sequence domain protein n=1 Tax=Kitasatospora griseola TaxID=2064 RepID=A0A0D0PSG3_KITGR|nr:hypothetical protein [Kitasatospora griseola]KIQ65489.1 hypothetical protein TR51_16565 [Kitasatospora griseola]
MRHRLAALAAATALIALPAGTAGAAPGVPALRTDGPALNLGGPLSADLAYGTAATMYDPGSTTGVRCAASHIGGALAVDPNPPGIVSGPVDTLGFGACTSNIVGVISVTGLTMDHLPYTLAVSGASGYPVVLVPVSGSTVQATLVLKTPAGTATCVFRTNVLNGNATHGLTQIDLSNQNFTKAIGPSTCFPTIGFSASYGPVDLVN